MKNKTISFLILLSISILTVILIYSCTPSIFSKTNAKANKEIIGQTVPHDMVFIKGTRDLPSFYMSVSEEPNINYLIYLEWLKFTFGESYPDVYENALPKKHEPTDLFKFNDPFVSSYMTHPAFSYYPVTGLSWLQIQDYLQWKTDRLNEAILIETGILQFYPYQIDGDNFNTEAYLFGQYEGVVRKQIHSTSGQERSVAFKDGILLPGFRLPTEAEWEHASQSQFQKPIDRKRCLDPFSKEAINHPYGQNYFTLRWGELYENEFGPYKYSRKFIKDIINVSSHRDKGFPYTPDENDKLGKPQRLTSIGDYDPKINGLINMESNVREWVMDIYEEEFNEEIKDPLVILEKSGFKTSNAALLDEDGNYVEKDSLGRMRDFRVLGVAHDGKALEIGNYFPTKKSYNNTLVKRLVKGGTWKNPGKQRMPLGESESDIEVGFRTVIPYTGIPSLLTKVKWKR